MTGIVGHAGVKSGLVNKTQPLGPSGNPVFDGWGTTSGHLLRSNGAGAAPTMQAGGNLIQVKHYENSSRGTPSGSGNYINWGSFVKLGGTDTDLFCFGIIWAHELYGNNVGNPSILWNGIHEYGSWARHFDAITIFQIGHVFNMSFKDKSAATADISWHVPSEANRWQVVVNPTNSDTGVSNRYAQGTGSTITVMEIQT